MHNTSSTEQYTWIRTISAAVNTIEVISSGNRVALSYHELVFYVTARNDIGESCQGEVRGGFPVGEFSTNCGDLIAAGNCFHAEFFYIVPGEFNFSYITHEVCFQQSTGNPQLEISFKVGCTFIVHIHAIASNCTWVNITTASGIQNNIKRMFVYERIMKVVGICKKKYHNSYTLCIHRCVGMSH